MSFLTTDQLCVKVQLLLCRSDTDRRCIPTDVVLDPGTAADGHVARTGHAQTTPGEQ